MWSGADASYLAAITAAGRKYTWHGTLTDANGTTYSFDAEDIVKGSGQISKMVSSDTSLDIGTVYTSELTIRLYLAVNRYVLFGGTIDLYCDVDVNGSTYSVPMGEFIIASCTQEMACISITAYDAMTKLDSVNVVQDLGASTPFAWISFILSRAGLTLGTAQADIEAMPNGTELLTFTNCNTELTAMTCRDALAYLCMILCANAYVGRDGKVYVQQYSMTAADDIAANERFSSSFSDFTTNYTSVTLGVHATGTTEYYAQPTDDGLNYDLGANPWMQAGSAADREAMCRAILTDLNGISYEPYTVSIPIRPELDPMDVLTFSGNQASSDKGAVTSVVYKLGGAMTIKCSGENPRLAGAKSKTQKSLEALSSTVAKEINQMSVVQNSSAVTCGENTETSILTYNFEVTQEENTTMVDISVVLTSSASETEVDDVYTLSDIVAHLSFYVDGSEVNVYAPEFIVDEGKDTMTFNYSLSGLSVGAHEFDVRLEMDGGSGAIAADDVHEMLWGYGITFEVYAKSIEVTDLPLKTTFFAGQRLDYTGVTISQVYNNGLKDDVTSGSAFDPANGTVLTESDVGTLTVGVSYDTFETSFDLDVELLGFDLVQSANYLWETTPTSMGGDFVLVGTALKAVGITNVAAGLTVQYADVSVASDGTTTITDSGSLSHVFAGNRQGIALKHGNIIHHQWSSNAAYNNKFFEMGYVDLENETSGDMTVNVVYDADPSATIYALYRYTGNYFAQAFFVGDFLVFPCVKFTINTGQAPLPTYESYAIGVIEGTTITIHIMDASDYTESEFVTKIARGVARDYLWKSTDSGSYKESMINDAEWFVETSGGTINFYHMVCTNYGLSYTLDCSASTEIGDAGATMTKIAGCNMYQISASGRSGLFDPESCEYTEFANNAASPLAWDENKGMFFKYAMDGNYTKMYLYGSADLQDWVTAEKATSYFNEVGTALFPYNGHLMTIGRNSSASTGNKVVGAIVFEA